MKLNPGLYFAAVLTFLTVSAFPAAQAPEGQRFAAALYHFNLQYVAGDRNAEDRIVRESLAPLLDLYVRHPGWGADFEMQGYMVEQLNERFPDVFRKLKTLIESGQIDLVCFHYSDQFFLAYPRWDMDWSERLDRRLLDRLGVRRSGTVFTQEGQFGEGLSDFMKANGYDTAILPKNLYRYLHGDEDAAPYYDMNGVNVVIGGKGVKYEDGGVKLSLEWTFFDDGELLATGRTSPYSPDFRYDPAALAGYEDRLARLEADGVKLVTVGGCVRALKALGVKPAPLKPVLDGTWQAGETDNVFRWMGDYRGAHERDDEVLTTTYRSRTLLAAAETALIRLKNTGAGVDALEETLAEAWRKQLLAEVSDSTGWTPAPGEIEYALEMDRSAADAARGIIEAVKSRLNAPFVRINIATGEVVPAAAQDEPAVRERTECPVKVLLEGGFRDSELYCERAGERRWDVVARFTTKDWFRNDVRMVFPRTIDRIVYSPALMEYRVVEYPLDAFKPEKEAFYLPSPNGLIGIGENVSLIKHAGSVHAAWEYGLREKTVALRMLRPRNARYEWRVSVVMGTPAEAVEEAKRINTHPAATY
ncbi:MAG: hypothetical protein AB1742_04220 [bacterium]